MSATAGHNSLVPWQNVAYARTVPTWCDTGDDLLQAGPPVPTMLKVDVEGGEEGVLAGMIRLLRRDELRHVVFESSANGRAQGLLTEAGFAIKRIQSTGAVSTGWPPLTTGSRCLNRRRACHACAQ